MHIRRVIAALALLLLPLWLLGEGSASAHDRLVSTSPKSGATVSAPSAVTLTFNESVVTTGTMMQITGPEGDATDGAIKVSGTRVDQPLKSGLPSGRYTVEWRATSSDGHPVSGSFAFTVNSGSPRATATAPTSPANPTLPASTSRSSTSTSSAPTPPAYQVPTNATNNQPWLILGAAVLAAALIAGGAMVARKRLRDDEEPARHSRQGSESSVQGSVDTREQNHDAESGQDSRDDPKGMSE